MSLAVLTQTCLLLCVSSCLSFPLSPLHPPITPPRFPPAVRLRRVWPATLNIAGRAATPGEGRFCAVSYQQSAASPAYDSLQQAAGSTASETLSCQRPCLSRQTPADITNAHPPLLSSPSPVYQQSSVQHVRWSRCCCCCCCVVQDLLVHCEQQVMRFVLSYLSSTLVGQQDVEDICDEVCG